MNPGRETVMMFQRKLMALYVGYRLYYHRIYNEAEQRTGCTELTHQLLISTLLSSVLLPEAAQHATVGQLRQTWARQLAIRLADQQFLFDTHRITREQAGRGKPRDIPALLSGAADPYYHFPDVRALPRTTYYRDATRIRKVWRHLYLDYVAVQSVQIQVLLEHYFQKVERRGLFALFPLERVADLAKGLPPGSRVTPAPWIIPASIRAWQQLQDAHNISNLIFHLLIFRLTENITLSPVSAYE